MSNSIRLRNGSIDSLQAFRDNYLILSAFFNGPASAQTKLAEWKRIKGYGFKHSADAIIRQVNDFRKTTRGESITDKQAELAEVGVTERQVNEWTFEVEHTDRGDGEQRIPSHRDELSDDSGKIYNLLHVRHIVRSVPEATKIQMQHAINTELPTLIEARRLENEIFRNAGQGDPNHVRALESAQDLQQKMAPFSGNALFMTEEEIAREIDGLKTRIRERKHTGYYEKYLKYKAKYLALKKQLEQKN